MRAIRISSTQLVGLGCEANQINALLAAQELKRSDKLGAFTIQEKGGTRKAVENGIARVKEMLPEANKVKREPVPASHLMLGLQCGGSDGYSGISANPALGAAVDLLVRHGGTAILSETPEIYGAEHLLTRRAVTKRSRREADRAHPLVGGIHARNGQRDEQQSVARQQGGRAHHHPGEIARRRGEGRHDQSRRRSTNTPSR